MGGGGHSSCLESLREESGLITCSPPAPSHCHCLPAMVMVGGRKCPQLSNFSQRSPPFGPYCPLPLPFHFLSLPFCTSPKLYQRHSTPPLQCIVPTHYVFPQFAFYSRCRCVLVTLEIVLPTIRARRPNWAPLLLQQDDATLGRPASTCPSNNNSITSSNSCRRPQVQEHKYQAKGALSGHVSTSL